MRLAEVDWSVLRWSLVGLAAALLVGGSALAVSHAFWQKHERALKRTEARLMNARAQYQTLDEEEGLIARYMPRYVALEQGGVIGREKRLDWIDSLREAARAVRVPSLQYTIEAQRGFDPGVDLKMGDFELFASTVRLSVSLLHEQDLFDLLGHLRQRVAGLFGVRSCDITRNGDDITLAPDAVNLRAVCELQFITIRRDRGGA
jgi:hypothetical protein